MLLHSIRILFKFESRKVANKANVHHISILYGFFISQLSKSINDNTEEHIKHDDVYYNEEGQIMKQLDEVFLSLVIEVDRFSNVANTTSIPQAFV
jgi:hypothetical protein